MKGILIIFAMLAGSVAFALDFNSPLEKLAGDYQFTEGPVWIAAKNELLFSDIPANRIIRFQDGKFETFRTPSHNSNGLTLDKQGRLIACEHGSRSVTRTEADGTITTLADHYDGKRLNSPNDVVVKSDGAIYFTDPPFGVRRGEQELDFQGVYRIAPDGKTLTVVARDFVKPNGLAFTPDEKVLYVNDTERGQIRAFDVAFDTVPALHLYYGLYRRLPRMRLLMWSILFLQCLFTMERLPRMRLSIWSSILFLCFFTIDPIEGHLR